MIEVRQLPEFSRWLRSLRDLRARARIDARIARLAAGNFGDIKRFGGIGELRIDHGPGYRVYFVQKGDTLVILLAGGDKSTQDRDIRKAMELALRLES